MDNPFEYLASRITDIENLIKTHQIPQTTEPDCWFDVEGLRKYLPDKPARATIYQWTQNGLIPFHRPTKKLCFLKSEIDEWMKSGRKKVIAGLDEKTRAMLRSLKK